MPDTSNEIKPLIPSILDAVKTARFPIAPLPKGELIALPLPAEPVPLADPLAPGCIGTPCGFDVIDPAGVFANGAPEGPGWFGMEAMPGPVTRGTPDAAPLAMLVEAPAPLL